MSRALVLSLALCIAVLAGRALPVQAAPPEGPQITVLANVPGIKPERGIIAMGPGGGSPQTVFKGVGWSRPTWSADGSLLTFGAFGDWSGEVVAVAEDDGSEIRFFRHASLEGGNPVMAPDGQTVAYPYRGSVWFLDVSSGSVRPALPSRSYAGLEPSSFSPDGSKLAGTVPWLGGYAVAVDLRTGRSSLLAREASEPMYSPDGSEVAFIRWKNWRANGVDDGSPPIDELRVTRVGTFPRSRLLRRSHKLLAWPSWDPSGQRLAFIRTRVVENGYTDPKPGDALMAINADGTCLKKVYTKPDTTLYSAAWRPGPGREAGPISC
jgi:dipeptidyl aminopeptidase/acylaminoacyl peptidase